MSIKRILLPVNGRDDITKVADFTFALAAKTGAEVEVLHPFTPFYDVITGVGEAGSPTQISKDIEAVKARFEAEIAAAGKISAALAEAHADVTSRFVQHDGQIGDVVARRAFSSDLITVGNAAAFGSSFWRQVYDGALIHSTRPILIVPTAASTPVAGDGFAKDIVIAWNGTAESAHAVAAAQPFLASAQRVRLITVGDDPDKARSAEQMREYVALYDVEATAVNVAAEGRGVAGTLLHEAAARPGTLLVMGAYSHSRWRERFFGGVTEHILHHADVPVLMAH